MNDYDLYSTKEDCLNSLARFLNRGCLSLMVGAGTSMGFGLPDWRTLVRRCSENIHPRYEDLKKPEIEFSNEQLTKIIDDIKDKIGNEDEYVDLVRKKLYQGIDLDIELAKNNLLIALTSLLIGKYRGNVNVIVSLNFDSVLEWYLNVLGLKVLPTYDNLALKSNCDVEIIHLHGYLPHEIFQKSSRSKKIVFSYKEITAFQLKKDEWKAQLYKIYREKVFLSVGIGPDSVTKYIGDQIIDLDENFYKSNNHKREAPYGFFVIPEGELTAEKIIDLRKNGIIPVELKKSEIPEFIFNIAQRASSLNS